MSFPFCINYKRCIKASSFVIFNVVILLTSGGSKTISLSDVSMPSFQSSMKVLSLEGEALKYTKGLKYVGNVEARSLRQKIEPKVLLGQFEKLNPNFN